MNEKIKKAKEKKMTVGIFVDFNGTLGHPPEEERKDIKRWFRAFIPEIKFIFRDLETLNLENENFDILVVDYGGLFPGADGLVESWTRQVENFMDNYSDSLLIIWSSMTYNEFEAVVEADKLLKFNIIQRDQVAVQGQDVKDFWESLRKKLLKEDVKQKK